MHIKDRVLAPPYVKVLLLTCLLVPALIHASEECVPAGQALLPATEKLIPIRDLIENNKERQIILLGEHHDNMEHHRWQLQMITGFHTLNPKLVLGFEMFPRQSQPVLDRWVAGELSEDEFLKQVNWEEYWSFDARMYLPMFHYARMNRIPMVALNVDRALIQEVGKKGWDDTPASSKEGITKPLPASEDYRELLATVFMQHGEDHSGTPEELVARAMKMPGFARFVESQQVWDRAMAEGIGTVIRQHPKAQVVAVLGSGHMMYHFGVPEQLADIAKAKPAVLIPWDPEFECDYIQENFADAVIGLKPFRASEQAKDDDGPKLGVFLEHAEDGVLITKVIPDSIAAGLGIQANDVIVGLAGVAVTEIGRVIEIVKATQHGTWLPLKIRRNNEIHDLVARFPPQEISAASPAE